MAKKDNVNDDAPPLELGDRPPSAYSLNSDIATVAAQLIRDHDEAIGHLVNFKLAYQRRQTERVDETWDVDGVARAWVASDRERGLHTFDGGVWVRATTWDRLDPLQRKALILHHLLHLQMTPKHALKRVGHDVAEFSLVARTYGAWEENLVLWARALDDHAKGTPDRPIAVQAMEQARTTKTSNPLTPPATH